MKPTRESWAGVVLLAVCLVALPVWSQSTGTLDLGARRQLIESAQDAEQAGDLIRALDLGLRAHRIQETASLHKFLASVSMRLGRYADALGHAERCTALARDDSHVVTQRQIVLRGCEEMVVQLRTRVGRIVVQVPQPVPEGLRVMVAGQPLNDAFYGVPYSVNPGEVEIVANAQGREEFRQVVTVQSNQSEDVRVTLNPVPESPATVEGAGNEIAPVTSTRSSGGVSVGPVVVLGLGVASLAVSAVLAVVSMDANGQFQSMHCNPVAPLECRPEAAMSAEYQRLQSIDTAAWVMLGLGTAAVVGGALWLVVDRTTSREQASRRWRPFAVWSGREVLMGVGGVL
jgi:hypothetical protein